MLSRHVHARLGTSTVSTDQRPWRALIMHKAVELIKPKPQPVCQQASCSTLAILVSHFLPAFQACDVAAAVSNHDLLIMMQSVAGHTCRRPPDRPPLLYPAPTAHLD